MGFQILCNTDLTDLQVCPDERLASCVVKVALHQEVEEVGCVAANGTQLGVTTLQDFVAESGTHVGTPFEKRAGKLEGKRKTGRSSAWVHI